MQPVRDHFKNDANARELLRRVKVMILEIQINAGFILSTISSLIKAWLLWFLRVTRSLNEVEWRKICTINQCFCGRPEAVWTCHFFGAAVYDEFLPISFASNYAGYCIMYFVEEHLNWIKYTRHFRIIRVLSLYLLVFFIQIFFFFFVFGAV